MSQSAKGSLRASKSKDDRASTSKASVSSLPTPSNAQRASTLRSLRNRLFRPTAPDAAKQTGPPRNGQRLTAGDLSQRYYSSSNSSLPSAIPTGLKQTSVPSSSSFSGFERATSPSLLSSASMSSLLPRPHAPHRESSRRSSTTRRASVPSAGVWLSQKEPTKEVAMSPADDGLLAAEGDATDAVSDGDSTQDVKDAHSPDPVAAASFDAIPRPHPGDAHVQTRQRSASRQSHEDEDLAEQPPNGHRTLHRESHLTDTLPVTPTFSERSRFVPKEEADVAAGLPDAAIEERLRQTRRQSALAAIFLNDELQMRPSPSPPGQTPLKEAEAEASGDDVDLAHEVEVSRVRSPLDKLVYGLGGRPMSQASTRTAQTSSSEHGGGLSPRQFLPESGHAEPAATANGLASHHAADESTTAAYIDSMRDNGKYTTSDDSSVEDGAEQERYRQHMLESASETTPTLPQTDGLPEADRMPREVDPTTAKRWSIVEMEESYRRMQTMLHSSRASSYSVAFTEDGRQTPTSNSVIVDRALAGLAAEGAFDLSDLESSRRSLDDRLSAPGSSPKTPLSPPKAVDGSVPPNKDVQQQAAEDAHLDPEDERPASPDEDATLLPGHFPSTSQRLSNSSLPASMAEEGDLANGVPTSAFDMSHRKNAEARRHTLDEMSSREELRNRFRSGEGRASTITPTRGQIQRSGLGRSRSQNDSTRGAAPRLLRHKTDESITTTGDDEEGGWATPMTSVSPGPGGSFSRSASEMSWLRPVTATPTFKSRVGRGWQRERGSNASSSDGGHRTPGGSSSPTKLATFDGISSRASGSSRVPADHDVSGKRRANASRRVGAGNGDMRDTWFDDTPGRSRARSRGGLASRLSDDRDGTASPAEDSDHTISGIRRADKVELFLRFSQAQAELEAVRKQSVLEREALLDALNESRDVVRDLRGERNRLEAKLEKETASLRALSAALGGEDVNTDTVERLADLARTKSLWQQRAQKAASELERRREDLARFEMAAEAARDRDDDNAREIRRLEDRIEALNQQLQKAKEVARTPSVARSQQQQHDDEKSRSSPTPESSPDASRQMSLRQSPTKPATPKGQIQPPTSSSRGRNTHTRAASSLSSIATSSLPSSVNSRPASGIPSPRIRQASTTSSTASLDAVPASSAATPLPRTKSSMPPQTPASIPRASKLPSPSTSRIPPPVSARSPARSPQLSSSATLTGGSSSSPEMRKSRIPGASSSASPLLKSGLPKPKTSGLPTAAARVSRESSVEPDTSFSTTESAFGLDDTRQPGPRSDVWPTPSLKGSNGDFKIGLSVQDESFLAELESDSLIRATDDELSR